MECIFYPHCLWECKTSMEVLEHIKEHHKPKRGITYGSKYTGNGSLHTIEINNDRPTELQKRDA